MNEQNVHILMVDDHPSMIEGYKSILSYNDLGCNIQVTAAHNCKDAYNIITKTDDIYSFQMAFIDLSLPSFEEKQINSGEDIAKLVKSRFPNTRIVILTSHAEAFILYKIQKKISPDGILVKSDFTADEFLIAFEKILNGDKYVSKTVTQSIDDLLSNEVFLDEYNRQLITLLSKGIKSKNLPNYINLSMSAIDKRKAQIKDYFCIQKGTDEDIIREAKKHGFI